MSLTHVFALENIFFFFHKTFLTCHRGIVVTLGELGFHGVSAGKESTCNAGDLGSTPGLGRSSGGRYGNQLHYSCLENVHGQRSLGSNSQWGLKELNMTE